jgi:hypothetical protein
LERTQQKNLKEYADFCSVFVLLALGCGSGGAA